MGTPVGAFYGSGLLDKGPLLEIFRVEVCALVGVFEGNVATDRTTFVEDETIVLEKDARIVYCTLNSGHARTSRTGT
jgi:hypothetical protein